MARLPWMVVALAGCGRIAFDPQTDARPDDATTSVAVDVTLTGPGADWARGVSLRPDRGFAVVGQIASAQTIAGLPAPFVGEQDVLLLYLDATGAVERVQAFGGNTFDTGTDVVVDADGNSYVVGTVGVSTNFGTGSIPVQEDDAYLVSFGPNGAYRWHRIIGGPVLGGGNDSGFAIALNGSDVIVSGAVSGTVDFGIGNTAALSTGRDAFVAAYTQATGSYRWAHRFGRGSGGNTIYGVAATGDTIYLAGQFEDAPDFLGTPLASAGGEDGVIASLDAGGALRWVRSFGGVFDDTGYAVAVTPARDVYIAGHYRGATSGTITLPAGTGTRDGFIAKLDDAGTLVWAKPLGATVCSRLYGVTALANGNVVAVGGFRDRITLPTGPLVATNASDALVLEVSPSGDVVRGDRFGAAGDDFAVGVAGTARGSLVVAASLASMPDAACGGLSSSEEQDFFLGSF